MPILIVSLSHAGQIHNVTKIAFGKDIKIVSAAGAGNALCNFHEFSLYPELCIKCIIFCTF